MTSAPPRTLSTASAAPLPTSLAGLSLQFDASLAAPLFAVSGGQINFQVPWELAGQSQATICAAINGETSATQTLNLAAYAPGLFSTNSQGSGPGAILDSSYNLIGASNPATGVTIIQIGGASATVLFSGLAPGAIGEYQVDALVPAASSKGAAVQVTIAIGGATSNAVTIAVQ